uniref:probable RuBisCO transcriptional regulator n=1 Tax=Chrysotila carterae TaxID=13221 RepID=UPI0022F2BA33|nr:probable RuBisCO transcriptional regulator [Chrysotila carterae]WAK83201.1 probable RuBisCO transcriptional regulator [Chrysotila carterae]
MSNLPFTLDQLKIVYTITREGSFRRAAENLYISQPAVSLQVQNLEKKLNSLLFYRNKKKVTPTEAGQLLTKYAKRILNLCEEVGRSLDELQTLQTGVLTVGASQTIGTYLMPRLLGIFRHRYPQIEVKLRIYSTRKIAWNVANGHIDLAIVGGEVPKNLRGALEITSYAEDELALILSTAHPFSTLGHIPKEDLYRLRFITLNNNSTVRKVIEYTLMQNGIDSQYLKIEMELNSLEAIKNAVQSGLGAAFVSVCAISKELELNLLQWVRIDGITIKRTLSILVNPKHCYIKVTKTFKKDILEMSSSYTSF